MHDNKRAQQPPEHLVVGRVVRPHGIRGALILEALSPMIRSIEPESVVLLGAPPEQVTVLQIRPHRDRYLTQIAGCNSREQAERYRGMELRIPFDQVDPLPEGEYYYWQILGMMVSTMDGESLGEITRILETGANDVYVVQTAEGKEILIPAIAPVIKEIDLDNRTLRVELLPGLLAD
jgi:16S rRNA processing protein RimM